MNPLDPFLETFTTILHLVILIILLLVLCVGGLVVLIVGVAVFLFMGSISHAIWKERTPSINPVGILGVPMIIFGVSLAANYFVWWFLWLLLSAFLGDVAGYASFQWVIIIIILIVRFFLLIIAGGLISIMSAKFHVLQAIVVAVGYLGIWYLYLHWMPVVRQTSIPLWVGYLNIAIIFGGAILGSIFEPPDELPTA